MIAKYNNLSVAVGGLGFVIQTFGVVVMAFSTTTHERLQVSATVAVGTAMVIMGLALYAMAKGRSTAWCLLGFLGIIGLLILYYLEDYEAPDSVPTITEDGMPIASTNRFNERSTGGMLHSVALMLGIFSVFCVIPLCAVPGFNLPFIVATLICGYKALGRTKRDPTIGRRGTAITAIALGYIGIAVNIAFAIAFVVEKLTSAQWAQRSLILPFARRSAMA